ncbi:hypothetical protein BN946_scf185016.g59 [Trametes cinnabarina]|uniref:F-box domain-containing protein n=1 Tax=Pycnoporus cinnabarinus TaxID=5643 RepID=A0A060SHC2_PYCCI|nr:hypothetical protein BN946_scf185016.g59 [Trametes cinnabarina]
MTMTLLSLPDELLVHIASYLEYSDLIALQLVCARWHEVIKSNAGLQYTLELRVAGMIDNPASRLVPGERLRILRDKEAAWRTLDLSDKRSLTLQHNPSGIYDLTGGTLLLGERRFAEGLSGTDAVHTINLHSAFEEEQYQSSPSLWSNLDLGKQVIDVGLAIQEHDLIAIVTYTYVNDAQLLASVDIHLLKHSTGQPHPAAAKPVIHFENIHYLPGHCSIMLEISGDTLCFLLNNYFPFINADPVTLVVYNWKTGEPKVKQKRSYQDPTIFNSFVLLSPYAVVLPIMPTNALEVCFFAEEFADSSASSSKQSSSTTRKEVPLLQIACALELPPLHPGALVLRMTCRCEPNPRGPPSSATHVDKTTPFYSDPECAVMILHLHIRLPIGVTKVYTMIVHRASLLKVVQTAIESHRKRQAGEAAAKAAAKESRPVEPDLDGDEDEDELTDEADIEEDGPHVPGAFFHPFGVPNPGRRGRWVDPSHDTESDEEADEDDVARLTWEEWGPAVTRWFQDELPGTRWITTTCGQRFVRVRSDGRLRVYDFNPLARRRFLHARSLNGSPVGALPGEDILEEHYSELSSAIVEDEDENEDIGDVEEADEDDNVQEAIIIRTRRADSRSEPERRMRVVLGTTRIMDPTAWEKTLESSLPYIETRVPVPDEYESALLDEDIIVGLKVRSCEIHM